MFESDLNWWLILKFTYVEIFDKVKIKWPEKLELQASFVPSNDKTGCCSEKLVWVSCLLSLPSEN